MDTTSYLERIGIDRAEETGFDFLARLMETHLLTVPFENLDILAGRNIRFDEDHLWRKVIENRRGGYCYELNTLFGRLLTHLGYTVKIVAGRVYNPKRQVFGPLFDHMALVVSLDREYLVDVGFGVSFRRPMALPVEDLPEGEFPKNECNDPCGLFRLQRDRETNEYLVEMNKDGAWQPRYRFDTVTREVSDFLEMNAIQQASTGSLFNKKVLCSIATREGWITLYGHTLITTTGGRTERVDLPSSDMAARLIPAHFGITGL